MRKVITTGLRQYTNINNLYFIHSRSAHINIGIKDGLFRNFSFSNSRKVTFNNSYILFWLNLFQQRFNVCLGMDKFIVVLLKIIM